MPKRRRSPDSDGTTTDAAATYNTIFIDTSFDTHFAIISTDSDTISDLKDKIVLEHERCFPEIGLVKIRALKVERKGSFYHLPDYMFVKCAFEGVNESWFLYVDVSKCNDESQIVKYDASNQMALLTSTLHDRDHLIDDCFKIPCDVHKVGDADIQNGSSSKHEGNIPAATQEFNDDNVLHNVSDSSGQSIGTCDSAKRLKRKHESLQAISNPTKLVEVNECIEHNAESEKRCSSSGKDNMTAPASIVSPVIPNSSHIDMPKMDHRDETAETNLLPLHDPKVNCTEELNPLKYGLEKPGKSTPSSTLSNIKEVNVHPKPSKKRTKSSKSKLLDIPVDQAKNLTADSLVVLPGTNGQELPESAESKQGRLVSGNHDVAELGNLESLDIHHSLHDDMLKIDNTDKTEERKLSAVHDPESEMRQTEEHDLLHRKSVVPSALLVTKEVKTHESSRKKRSKISGSGVQDEHMDRSTDSKADLGLLLPNVAASDHLVCESTAAKSIFSSKADNWTVELSLSTKTVDTDEATEGLNRGDKKKKKKKKVKKSGAPVKDQLHPESIVSENDFSLKQVSGTNPSSNLEGPDVLKDLEVNKAIKDGRVQERGDMNQDVDQMKAIVSPSLDNPGNLVPPSEKDEIYQKVEERDLLVDNNLEDMILPRDRPSVRDHNESVVETVSNTNTSTAIVAEEQKVRSTKNKRRARKTVSGANQDSMDPENTQTRTRPSSLQPDRHADLHVEKDKDLSPITKGIEASPRNLSDASRDKNTSPRESALNHVSADLKPQKDGEASECIGKEINFKEYFVSSHPQDEVSREPSVAIVAKKKSEENVPSAVSAPNLQQDLPKSSKKDSKISSAGKVNTLTESKRSTKTEKKIGKRGVPYTATSSDLDEIRTPERAVSSTFLNGSDATQTVPLKKKTVKSLASSGINSSYKTPLESNTRDRKVSSFRHHVPAGKNTSSKSDAEIVNKSKQMKSLRQTPKPIFRDVSSESSLDENGSVGSTATTRTPSDNLSSSSELSDDAMGNGQDDKDKGGSKKSISNSEFIPLDTIIKSSSRFKKAKLTASQQLEDPDSQFDDLLQETIVK